MLIPRITTKVIADQIIFYVQSESGTKLSLHVKEYKFQHTKYKMYKSLSIKFAQVYSQHTSHELQELHENCSPKKTKAFGCHYYSVSAELLSPNMCRCHDTSPNPISQNDSSQKDYSQNDSSQSDNFTECYFTETQFPEAQITECSNSPTAQFTERLKKVTSLTRDTKWICLRQREGWTRNRIILEL